MSTLVKSSLIGLVAGVAMLAAGSSAFAQANCEMYGRLALKQMQENEQKKCGLKGQEWNTDLKAHVAWCASVGPDQWKIQLQKREQALSSCAKKP
jgi:hypothetical protein